MLSIGCRWRFDVGNINQARLVQSFVSDPTYNFPGISTIGNKPAAFASCCKRWLKLTKARQWLESAKGSASAKSNQ
jgi:hypothetical protein